MSRRGWAVLLLGLLLIGCIESDEPLITAQDAVTPLPAQFSMAQANADGSIKTPDAGAPSKIPVIETVTLSGTSYLRPAYDQNPSQSYTFAVLDHSTYLLQVIGFGLRHKPSSAVYTLARYSGDLLTLYALPGPNEAATPAGAQRDDNDHSFVFSDLPHLLAAAHDFQAKAPPLLSYRVASTPDEISQLKHDVEAISPTAGPPKPAVQAAPMPVAPAQVDKLARSECFPATEATEITRQQSGNVAAALYGSSINDVGKFVDLDNDANVYIRMSLAIYKVGDKMKWALFKRDQPETHHPTDVCLTAAGDLRGDIQDFRSKSATMSNLFTSFDNAKALQDCKKIRPTVLRAGWAAKLADAHFDRPVTNGFHLQILSDMLGSETLSVELDQVITLRAAEQGDSRCDVLPALLTEKQKEYRLVAQLVGKEVFRGDVISDEEAFSFLLGDNGHWSILETSGTGATFEWAKGGRIDVNVDYFAQVFNKK